MTDNAGTLTLTVAMKLPTGPTELTYGEIEQYIRDALVNAMPHGSHESAVPIPGQDQFPIVHGGGTFGQIDVDWTYAKEYANV